MKNLLGILAMSAGLWGATGAMAQDVDIQGDGSNSMIILQGRNVHTGTGDRVGVQGVSAPIGWWGIGVKGIGGYQGVVGEVTTAVNANNGDRSGVVGQANNGATNIGVRGYAQGTNGTNIAVFGQASGTNSRAGKFLGDLEYTGTLRGPSDRRLKRNIVDLRNCLATLRKLAPKEYEFRTEAYPDMNLEPSKQRGLIAQDVEAVLPSLVGEARLKDAPEEGDKEAGEATPSKKPETYKTLNYMGLIPVLVGALKEQKAEIDALKKRIAQLNK